MANELRATAVVELTLRVNLSSPWDKDCKIEQVFKQAKDSALSKVNNLVQTKPEIQISGEPVVTAVLAQKED